MQKSPATAPPRLADNRVALVSLLVLIDSMHFIFARLLLPYISPNVSAMYVMAIGTLQIALYGMWTRRLDWRILGRHLYFFLGIGFLIAVSTNMNYIAVAYIDAGTASMLGKLTTIYSIGLGVFWLRERLAPMQVAGALLAIIGSVIIAYQPGDYLQIGSLMIIASTFMYALHAALVKRYSGDIEFLNFFFFRLLCTAVVLFLISAGRQALEWPTPTAWFWLALTATVDVVISRILYYVALRRLHMSLHAIVLTLSPVIAVLWSFLLFDELPGLQQALGGVAVLIGVLIATRNRRVAQASPAAAESSPSSASTPTKA